MGGRWHLLIMKKILLLLAFLQLSKANDCWESCFSPENRLSGLTREYGKIFQMIENLRAASATNGGIGEAGATNGTVFVLDTSSPSGASDSQQNLVLDLQRRLAQIMAFSMPNTKSTNPLFLVKFDGTRSWYCDEWTSLGRCEAFTKLETELDNYSTVDASAESTSNSEGATTTNGNIRDLLDDACYSASDAFEQNMNTFNELVVAFINSPFKTAASLGEECPDLESVEKMTANELDGIGGFQDFIPDPTAKFSNWCERKFAKRIAIGTLFANEDDMDGFASVGNPNWDGTTFVKETEDLLEAASNLAQCMNGQCCPVVSRRRRQASGDTCTEFKDNTMNTFSPS